MQKQRFGLEKMAKEYLTLYPKMIEDGSRVHLHFCLINLKKRVKKNEVNQR
jgi:hypothetical protein